MCKNFAIESPYCRKDFMGILSELFGRNEQKLFGHNFSINKNDEMTLVEKYLYPLLMQLTSRRRRD